MKMIKILSVFVIAMFAFLMTGCNERVPQGCLGRVSTAAGWSNEILKPGSHPCWGRDDNVPSGYHDQGVQ